MAVRAGYRGYVGSRPVRGVSVPQRVQNLVVRDHAARHGLAYRLSLVEHAMPGSYLILADALDELPRLDGLILFSLFMLPPSRARRLEVYRRVIEEGAALHAALENMALRDAPGIAAFEELIEVALTLPATPLGGRYDKAVDDERARVADPFWRALDGALAG